MPVRDLELALLEPLQHPTRYQVELLVVVAGLPGKQHLQTLLYGEIGADQEHGVGEAAVLWVGQLIEHLPGDDHAHNHGFPRSGGHLAGVADQAVVLWDHDALPFCRGGLHKPDEGLGRLPLAEEEPAFPFGVVPVVKELPGDGGDAGIAPLPPCFDPLPDGVHQLQLDELFLQERHLVSTGAGFEVIARRPPPLLDHGLALFVSPVAGRLVKGRVENGVVN